MNHRRITYRACENLRIATEEEGEVAGEVKRPGEPTPRRDDKHASAIGGVLAEISDGVAERFGVRCDPITDSAELHQIQHVSAATVRCAAADGPLQVGELLRMPEFHRPQESGQRDDLRKSEKRFY